MAGPCEGYYASVNLLAPSVLHKHFETWVNEEEFLASSLKCFNTETGQVEALPTLVEECAIWSNCLNCFVKAYAYDNIQVIYTDTLFTEEEFIKFQGMYTESLTDGVRPMLAHRREFFMEEYIYGLIDLSLKTKKPVNGCLKIDFSELKIYDSDGNQIDNRDTAYNNAESSLIITTPPLEDGVYTIASKVLSKVDGHLVHAAIIFGVGNVQIDTSLLDSQQQSETTFIPESISWFNWSNYCTRRSHCINCNMVNTTK